ncbi:hypothetical protein NEUTE2DRAFT_73552 [Neurospora tetrasperma FGSC 2509]|nr:hypothetical protein NEUTE2DRAFT_73552 [Neurospora tetrasperma FGSC 2509]
MDIGQHKRRCDLSDEYFSGEQMRKFGKSLLRRPSMGDIKADMGGQQLVRLKRTLQTSLTNNRLKEWTTRTITLKQRLEARIAQTWE